MPPYQGGGDMISEVSVTGSTWANPPAKFEAGTPAIAEAIGFAEAINFIQGIGWDLIAAHDLKLYQVAIDVLDSIPGVIRYGQHEKGLGSSIISFNLLQDTKYKTFFEWFGSAKNISPGKRWRWRGGRLNRRWHCHQLRQMAQGRIGAAGGSGNQS